MYFIHRYVTVGVLGCALFISMSLLFYGRDLTLQHVLTRSVDLVLLLGMAGSAGLGWYLLPRMAFAGRIHRWVQTAIVVYFTLLALGHGIGIQLMGKMELYAETFLDIPGYGYMSAAVFLGMIGVTVRLRFADTGAAATHRQ